MSTTTDHATIISQLHNIVHQIHCNTHITVEGINDRKVDYCGSQRYRIQTGIAISYFCTCQFIIPRIGGGGIKQCCGLSVSLFSALAQQWCI